MPFLSLPNISECRVEEEPPFSYGVKPRSGGRRVLSFLTSLLLHGLFCCVVFVFPSFTPELARSANGIPKRLAQSGKTYKLVWYRLNTLPDVSPQRPGTGVQAEKLVTSMQKIQVDAENAKSKNQMVWHPAPRIQLEQDLKSPNLVITQATLPPSPVKPKPKVFVPPRQQTTPVASSKTLLPLPPTIQDQQMRLTGLGGNSISMASVQTGPRPKPRAFIAPAPPPPNSDRPAVLPLDLPPAVTGPGAISAGSSVIVTTGITDPAPDAGPPLQPAAVGQTGVSGPVAAAVIGTAPEGDLSLPPEGNRSARLSTGGPDGTGAAEVQSAKVFIPGLSVQSPGASNDRTGVVSPAPPPFRPDFSPRLQSQPGRVPTQTLLSVPLRPNARRIPAWIEARFPSRVLYTSVLETSHGRWQIWFSEQNRTGSDAPPMRAPLPATSIVNAVWTISSVPGQKMQISAVVRKDGMLDSVTVIQALDSRSAQSIVEKLKLLRFTPAMRFNMPVDIDIVIDIPASPVTSLAEKTNP